MKLIDVVPEALTLISLAAAISFVLVGRTEHIDSASSRVSWDSANANRSSTIFGRFWLFADIDISQ